uniref:Uncharacterized protein n=1 Tax=viral metagenome TaxID=1070528 RepID=A0A6C0C1G4_9ZZZZ
MHAIARQVGSIPFRARLVVYRPLLLLTTTCTTKPHIAHASTELAQNVCGSNSGEKAVTLAVHLSQRRHTKLMALTPEDCMGVLRLLNIKATAHSTLSNVSDTASGAIHAEPGVSLILQNIQKSMVRNKLWPLIRDRYGLTCAHVSEDDFHGCILDWMKPSICPGKTTT